MKLNLLDILSGFNLSQINTNFESIDQEFQNKVLYRNNPVGEPNAMENVLDMNSNKIINLGAPVNSNDAARLRDVTDALAGVLPSVLLLPVVDSIVDLKLVNKNVYDTVVVSGYYSARDGGGGLYLYDSTDTTSVDNGGTIIVGDDSGRWKLAHDGAVSIKQFGFKADWNGTTGTDNRTKLAAMIADTAIKKFVGSPGAYWFGEILGEQQLFTITRDIEMDWGGAELVCRCQQDGSHYISNSFFSFRDCRVNCGNYIFDDIGFDFALNSRGVQPVTILADSVITYGHTLGPMYVKRGQSLLTAFSNNPNTARSKGISFKGHCVADNVYYGLDLSSNGDDVDVHYRLRKANRAIFLTGVNNVDATFSVEEGQAASSNLLISNRGTGHPSTRDIRIRAKFDSMGGPLAIVDQPEANGTGIYENIDVELSVAALGGSLSTTVPIARMGAFDVDGNYYTVEKTVKMDNIRLCIIPQPAIGFLDNAIQVYTPSPNYGKFFLNEELQFNKAFLCPKNAAGVFMGPVFETNGQIWRAVFGDLTVANAVVVIPHRYLSVGKKNCDVILNLRIQARNGVGGANEYTYREYMVIGRKASTGAFTLTSATQIATVSSGATVPVLTVTNTGAGDLQVAATLYTNAGAQMVAALTYV